MDTNGRWLLIDLSEKKLPHPSSWLLCTVVLQNCAFAQASRFCDAFQRHCQHCSILGYFIRSLQPDLPPIGIDASWAGYSPVAIPRTAYYALHHDANSRQLAHLTRFLIDDSLHAVHHAVLSAAEGHHLRVEIEAPVFVGLIQSRQNLLIALDLHELASA